MPDCTFFNFFNFSLIFFTHVRRFSGPAKVFDREEAALDAVLTGQIRKGDVLVIRYEGPKGGPGMREMLQVSAALVGAGLGRDVALITDGGCFCALEFEIFPPYLLLS